MGQKRSVQGVGLGLQQEGGGKKWSVQGVRLCLHRQQGRGGSAGRRGQTRTVQGLRPLPLSPLSHHPHSLTHRC